MKLRLVSLIMLAVVLTASGFFPFPHGDEATGPTAVFSAYVTSYATQYARTLWRGTSGKRVTVNWGDGNVANYDMTGTGVQVYHDYAANGTYTITVSGALSDITRVTTVNWSSTNRWCTSYPRSLASMPNLQRFWSVFGEGDLAATFATHDALHEFMQAYGSDGHASPSYLTANIQDEAVWPGKTAFAVWFQTSPGITGDLINVYLAAETLTTLRLVGTDASGELGRLDDCDLLQYVQITNASEVSGDIEALIDKPLKLCDLTNTGVSTYTSGTAVSWDPNVDAVFAGNTALDSVEVADLFTDLDGAATSWTTPTINVSGCGGGSLTAAQIDNAAGKGVCAALTAKGWTVTTD